MLFFCSYHRFRNKRWERNITRRRDYCTNNCKILLFLIALLKPSVRKLKTLTKCPAQMHLNISGKWKKAGKQTWNVFIVSFSFAASIPNCLAILFLTVWTKVRESSWRHNSVSIGVLMKTCKVCEDLHKVQCTCKIRWMTLSFSMLVKLVMHDPLQAIFTLREAIS